MNDVCQLANTGINSNLLVTLAVAFLVCSLACFSIVRKRRPRASTYYLVAIVLSLGIVFGLQYKASAQTPCNSTGGAGINQQDSDSTTPDNARVWTPSGRFVDPVFELTGVTTDEDVVFGSEVNFAGDNENLRMTINQPSQDLDTEANRPLIVAFPGGETMGFCDQTFNTEQDAMLELAQYGYVTATVTQLVDPAFCSGGGAQAQDYHDNMLINLKVINKAIQYMYDNATTYKIDQQNTALYGFSIGGQIAMFKIREDHTDAPHVKVIAALAAIAPSDYDAFASPRAAATAASPDILMISFEPDTGYGPDIDPDARADCEYLNTLGHNCVFEGLQYPAHPVHANSDSPFEIPPDMIPVKDYFRNYMYHHLVLGG